MVFTVVDKSVIAVALVNLLLLNHITFMNINFSGNCYSQLPKPY